MKQLLAKTESKNLANGRRDRLRPLLPRNWRKMVVAIAPEYDSLDGATLLNNFHRGKSSDEKLLDIWDRIIDEVSTQEKRAKQSQKRAKIAFPA